MSGNSRRNLYTNRTTSDVVNEIHHLKSTDELESFIRNGKHQGESFGLFLSNLMSDRHLSVPKLCALTHSQISESYLYKLLEDRKAVSRENVIRIGVAIRADLNTMNLLLKMAGYGSLSRNSAGDIVVLYAINKNYEDHDEYWIEENLKKNNSEYHLFSESRNHANPDDNL